VGSECKTVGDGLSRLADVVERTGSGVDSLARDLAEEAKKIVSAVGKKAEAAIGPATVVVEKLLSQYVKEQEVVVRREVAAAIGFSVAALGCLLGLGVCVLGLVCCEHANFAFVFSVFGTVSFSVVALLLVVDATMGWWDSLNRAAELTSRAVDRLTGQVIRIKEGLR
jgi:hypothetical protein